MLVVLNRLDNWAGDERHRFCVNASGHFVEFFLSDNYISYEWGSVSLRNVSENQRIQNILIPLSLTLY
jgi:hypothetical protein